MLKPDRENRVLELISYPFTRDLRSFSIAVLVEVNTQSHSLLFSMKTLSMECIWHCFSFTSTTEITP